MDSDPLISDVNELVGLDSNAGVESEVSSDPHPSSVAPRPQYSDAAQ